MRLYVPATSTTLRRLLDTGLVPGPVTAFAVTPAFREWYREGDEEELEYAAGAEAARACLRLLDADPAAARRRVVLAVDVPASQAEVRDDVDRGVVRVVSEISVADVAAVLIDDVGAEQTVARAVGAIDRADLGDAAAEEAVDDAEGHELAWYATQELGELVTELTPPS